MKATIKMRKRPSKGKHFFQNSNCNFFFQGPSQSLHLRDWNTLSQKWRLLKRSKGFLFFSLYFLVNNNYCSEKKRLKTGEDNSYVLPTPVASMNKIQGIISLSQLFCLALGWHWPKLNFQTQKKIDFLSYIFSVSENTKIIHLIMMIWLFSFIISNYKLASGPPNKKKLI